MSVALLNEAPGYSGNRCSETVTIVTGAGSGLGRAIAVGLARRGHHLGLIGRRKERLLETHQLCVEAGASPDDCMAVELDVTCENDAAKAFAFIRERLGSISALVNNAGLARFAELEQADPADWQHMLQTNLIAPALLTKLCARELRAVGGAVVNVGSIGGTMALPGRALYGASKAALAHLTRSLARELAPKVRVNAIIPGAIETEMYENLGLDENQLERLRGELLRTTPLGRLGAVDDVVPWVEMLLGPPGAWVTGSLIVIDGGRSC